MIGRRVGGDKLCDGVGLGYARLSGCCRWCGRLLGNGFAEGRESAVQDESEKH